MLKNQKVKTIKYIVHKICNQNVFYFLFALLMNSDTKKIKSPAQYDEDVVY